MGKENKKGSIEKRVKKFEREIVGEVKDYIFSQKDLWNQIPDLARQVDNKLGTDNYAGFYGRHLLALNSSIYRGTYNAFIDFIFHIIHFF